MCLARRRIRLIPSKIAAIRFQRHDRQATLLHLDGHFLRQRRAPSGPCLRSDLDRRHCPLQAAGRLRRLLPDRDGRARPEGRILGARRRHGAESLLRHDRGAVPGDDADTQHLERRIHPDDRTAPLRIDPGDLAEAGRGRRYLSGQLRRLVLGPGRGLYRRGRTGQRRRALVDSGRGGSRVDRGAELLFPPVGLYRQAAGPLRGQPRVSPRRRTGATN